MTTYAEVDGQYIDEDGYLVDAEGSLVYFVQEAAGHERIKIGYTTSMKHRIRQLQTGSPEVLIIRHTEPGGKPLEQRFHRRWWRFLYRKGGEWFHPAKPILAYIASAPAGSRGTLLPSPASIPWRKVGRVIGITPRGAFRILFAIVAWAFTRRRKYKRSAIVGVGAGMSSVTAYSTLDPAYSTLAIVALVLAACLIEGSRK